VALTEACSVVPTLQQTDMNVTDVCIWHNSNAHHIPACFFQLNAKTCQVAVFHSSERLWEVVTFNFIHVSFHLAVPEKNTNCYLVQSVFLTEGTAVTIQNKKHVANDWYYISHHVHSVFYFQLILKISMKLHKNVTIFLFHGVF
jgi:hypothetical protein